MENILSSGSSSINVAGFKDLISMKAIAIVQRGTAKDFVDLYFLMKESGINIKELYSFLKKNIR